MRPYSSGGGREIRWTTATRDWLVWRYDLCSGSDQEMCGRGRGGPAGAPRVLRPAGAPGAGKTYTLHRLFGLENVEMLAAVDMLDLDSAMKRHPEYSEERPAELYGKIDAYNWANERVERRFQKML